MIEQNNKSLSNIWDASGYWTFERTFMCTACDKFVPAMAIKFYKFDVSEVKCYDCQSIPKDVQKEAAEIPF